MKKIHKNYSTNCQSCGKEALNYQLRPFKVGSLVLDLCSTCGSKTEAYDKYKEAIKLLQSIKVGQVEVDNELSGPNVVIEPIQPAIQKAVNLLKRMDPNYFKGVRKIVVGASPQYGHVESGPNKDSSVININLQKIIQEAGGDPNSQDVITAAATTIAHERGHVLSYSPEGGFAGGESPAEAEEKRVAAWIANNKDMLNWS